MRQLTTFEVVPRDLQEVGTTFTASGQLVAGGRQIVNRSINYDIIQVHIWTAQSPRLANTQFKAGVGMTGADKVEIFGPDGNLVFTATGATTYTRIKFEPFN